MLTLFFERGYSNGKDESLGCRRKLSLSSRYILENCQLVLGAKYCFHYMPLWPQAADTWARWSHQFDKRGPEACVLQTLVPNGQPMLIIILNPIWLNMFEVARAKLGDLVKYSLYRTSPGCVFGIKYPIAQQWIITGSRVAMASFPTLACSVFWIADSGSCDCDCDARKDMSC